jgi:hypothetical protein
MRWTVRDRPFRLLATLTLAATVQAAGSEQVLPLPALDLPQAGAGSSDPAPVTARAQPRRRLVYSCVEFGHVTFADRPCGPLPVLRELQVLVPPPAGAAGAAPEVGKSTLRVEPVQARPPAQRQPAAQPEPQDSCRELEAALDALDSRMRAGYSAREAASLWERWRTARGRLRAADC